MTHLGHLGPQSQGSLGVGTLLRSIEELNMNSENIDQIVHIYLFLRNVHY